MNKQKSKKQIRIIEGALLIALCITLCTGLWARAQQQKLSGELVRLHVIAASDSDADQALKLRIRDRALMHLTPLLDRAQSVDDARAVIESELPHLEKLANDEIAAAGFDYSAAAALAPERYPTREYMGFALPAGSYLSLRITLGGGEGQNWWCVVFPPLCMTAVEERESIATLSENSKKLIFAEEEEYILKFRLIEFFESISPEHLDKR
ncbi:MAG: stage II sporulation protein R [Oscillospiraceae bacterium]|nr:stage II sporulation protein R [Oscillospiraceae bacterium]